MYMYHFAKPIIIIIRDVHVADVFVSPYNLQDRRMLSIIVGVRFDICG